VTLEQMRKFHAEFYGASVGEIGVVGDVTPDAMVSMFESVLGGWRSPAAYARIPDITRTNTPLNVNLETPDKANAIFVAARAFPVRDDSRDYPALALADYMLGGGFLNSRLATRIRQKDGLSYGVQSIFQASASDSSAQWIGFAIYAPQNRDKLEAAFREELLKAAVEGFTAEEIAKAKEGWISARKGPRAQDGVIARHLGSNLFLGRQFAADEKLEAAVAALTPAELQAVVKRYLDPDALAVVKAGDFRPKPVTPATP
jgi:zinc protease